MGKVNYEEARNMAMLGYHGLKWELELGDVGAQSKKPEFLGLGVC